MMGEQARTESLFYYFRLEEQIPEDHLLRLLDRYIDFSFVRERLKTFYSSTGRPSIDPEVLLRLLLVGYLYGITSERRLLNEVRMHLAYRWFTRLDLNAEIPDHSTFSKNRHGRFRQSGVFREVFEEIVRRCVEAGLVEGETLAVDGTMVAADASQHSRIRREELREAAQVSRTVQQYLAELEQANPVAEPALVSTTDPRCTFGNQGWRIGADGLLRQLSHRHCQSGDSGGGSNARALSPGDGSCAKDDGEK
jgi:transposase